LPKSRNEEEAINGDTGKRTAERKISHRKIKIKRNDLQVKNGVYMGVL
jgi:hypothetical protein